MVFKKVQNQASNLISWAKGLAEKEPMPKAPKILVMSSCSSEEAKKASDKDSGSDGYETYSEESLHSSPSNTVTSNLDKLKNYIANHKQKIET